MDEEKDRRSFDRLIFNNGTAAIFRNFWYYNLKYNLLRNFTSFMPEKSAIHNLSSSGSCIYSKTNFKRGDSIRLIITIPDVKNILIKGTVRWITEGDSPSTGNIGIQFLAFSNWNKYNSFNILKQLQVVILLKNQSTAAEIL